ncbi:hypothetical protein [Acetobacter cerevisiae]|uniref:hypothetical protein n=1 Tax=Acetobacter cerevisiae TaxID=178900 RepID=UPI0020A0870F|nr:hypothetical protein [Acetobacter cerevisiae]MCP1270738.1 hypothetical protein [Acetobacter cerevisiae]MCP1278738.1 hypothetical protein [Acetobacter cerevisiae]
MLKVITFPIWGVFWLLFYLPGKLIIEFQYLFPEWGPVIGSGRRKDSVVAAIIKSFGFWIAVAVAIFFLVAMVSNQKEQEKRHHNFEETGEMQ